MDTFGQLDPASELLRFVQSADALNSKLAQEIIDSHLAFYSMVLIIFFLFFLLFAGVANSARPSNLLNAEDSQKLKVAAFKWSFFMLMLSIWPMYKLAQGFFFPRIIIINQLAEMVGMK